MRTRPILFIVAFLAIGLLVFFTLRPSPQSPAEPAEHIQEEGGHDEDGKDEHGGHEEEDHDEHGEEHGDVTEISDKAALESGIETLVSGPAKIEGTLSLTGRIALNQNTTAQVKARFPGIVREVKKGLGETVEAGDVLASVESNDSLLVYPIKAPIGGVILARNTNIGDVAGDQALFVIANLSEVWAEFFVFPKNIGQIKAGQAIRIQNYDGSVKAETIITSLLPVAEASSQTVVVRAVLGNAEGFWRSGMSVRGEVVTAEKEVPLAVASAALQRHEGLPVVFVKDNEAYHARQVKTGLKDPHWIEILAGLEPGEIYVSKNSFVVKADIGKSSAEHEH